MRIRRRPPPPGFLAAFLLVSGMFAVKSEILLIVGLAVTTVGAVIWFGTRGRVDRIGMLLVLNVGWWLASGLLVGGVSLGDLLTPGYYQEEGRIFLYYLPLAYFSVAVARRDSLGAFTKGAQLLAYLSGILLLIWLIFSPAQLSRGSAGIFVGLMTSHTGAGTVFGALAVFLILSGLSSGNRQRVVAGAIAGAALMATESRQGIVALLAVLAWYVMAHGRVRTKGRVVLVGAALVALLITITPASYQRLVRVLRPEAVSTIVRTLETSDWEPGDLRTIDDNEDVNVLTRMLYWGHAYRLFARSPLFGVGFGRYNDEGVQFVRVLPGVTLGLSGTKRTELESAHNSYLQVAAEVGLLGLGLLLLMWARIFKRLGRAALDFAADREVSAYFVAARGVVLFTLVGALFGHALAAPAIGFTVLSIAGLGLAVSRSEPAPEPTTPDPTDEGSAQPLPV